ncbi:MAG TPA: hypothetical protein ENK18_00360 [Deltaproteobacteria bacterium]|nr:hypothetical protein [Deltaproteobacteria bacterium]
MPSSTSSSDALGRAPELPWGRLWLLGLAIALGILGGAEGLWRSRGHRPVVDDGPGLWSASWRRVSEPGALVLLGASRIQVGLDLDRIHDALGLQPVMLAIDASSPRPILEALAHDGSFHGRVLCSVTAETLVPGPKDRRPADWLARHRRAPLDAPLNRWASIQLQQRLVLASYGASLHRIVYTLLRRGTLPEPSYLYTRADRERSTDFSRVPDLEIVRRGYVDRLKGAPWAWTPATWLEATEPVQAWAQAIEERGGSVLFVRLPTSGALRALEDARAPRDRFWDRFAERSPAPAVHLDDLGGSYHLPDDSHVDRADRAGLTDVVIRLVADHLQP